MRDLYAFNNTYQLLISVTDGNYTRENKKLNFLRFLIFIQSHVVISDISHSVLCQYEKKKTVAHDFPRSVIDDRKCCSTVSHVQILDEDERLVANVKITML